MSAGLGTACSGWSDGAVACEVIVGVGLVISWLVAKVDGAGACSGSVWVRSGDFRLSSRSSPPELSCRRSPLLWTVALEAVADPATESAVPLWLATSERGAAGVDWVRFFESGNVEALADAMLEMIRDPARGREMAKRASGYAARNSWDTRKAEYLGLVDSLCKGGGRNGS